MTARLATDCRHRNNFRTCPTCMAERAASDDKRKQLHVAYALILNDVAPLLERAPDAAARERMATVVKFLEHRERLFQ